MKVTLKPIPLPPLMIGTQDSVRGDVVVYAGPNGPTGPQWVTSVAGSTGLNMVTRDTDGKRADWGGGSKFKLLSRIGGMPTQSHRLGDLPIGSIVPGREIGSIGDELADVLFRTIVGPGMDVYFEPIGRKYPTASRHPDTRIAVAYEAIELEEPE